MAFNLFDFSGTTNEDNKNSLLGKAFNSLAKNEPLLSGGPQETFQKVSSTLSQASQYIKNVGYNQFALLGDKVKQKYPGAYDKIDSTELGKKTLAKYPEYQQWMNEKGSVLDNPISGTLSSLVSAPLEFASFGAEGISHIGRGAEQLVKGEDLSTAATNVAKGFTELGGAGLSAPLFSSPVGAALGTVMTTESGKEVMSSIGGVGQSAVKGVQEIAGLDTKSEASKNIQEIGGMLIPLAIIGKGIQKAPAVSYDVLKTRLEKTNRIPATKYEQFKKMTGQDVGEYLAQNGLLKTGEGNIAELVKRFDDSKKATETALESVKGEFKLPRQGEVMINELMKRNQQNDKNLAVVSALKEKNNKTGLTLSEANTIKRMYEQDVSIPYLKENKASEAKIAKDVDSAVREWQINAAESQGFTNLREMNKQTQANKFLLDNIEHKIESTKGNDSMSLTDRLLLAHGTISPRALGMLVGKKLIPTNITQNLIQKGLAKTAGIKGKDLLTPTLGEKALPEFANSHVFSPLGKSETQILSNLKDGMKNNQAINKIAAGTHEYATHVVTNANMPAIQKMIRILYSGKLEPKTSSDFKGEASGVYFRKGGEELYSKQPGEYVVEIAVPKGGYKTRTLGDNYIEKDVSPSDIISIQKVEKFKPTIKSNIK